MLPQYLSYYRLLEMLQRAEFFRDDTTQPADVRANSAETVTLCEQRMATEGLTRAQLMEKAAYETYRR